MATDSAVKSVTNTLTTTVADAITLTQGWPVIAVTNHDAADLVYVTINGATAVAAADGTSIVLPGQTRVFPGSVNSAGQTVISIVGDGGVYTVEGTNSYADAAR